jgi:hypothetical protein
LRSFRSNVVSPEWGATRAICTFKQ